MPNDGGRIVHVMLIDGSAYAHRAFHAANDLRTHNGQPVGALLVFCRLLWSLLRDATATHALIAWDAGRSGWRRAIHPEYKSNRAPAAPDLAFQLPLMREAATAFGLASDCLPEWEADDIIATHTAMARKAGAFVTIYTRDKDMLQLVDDHCSLINPHTGKMSGADECRKKFGVEPWQVPDAQGLIGDTSDNIPGVPMIGSKGAARLIRQWGNLENLYANIARVHPQRYVHLLAAHRDSAFMSRALASLSPHAPINAGQDLRWHGINYQSAAAFARHWNLTGLASALEQESLPT